MSVASFENIFSYSESCLFVLLMVTFAMQKLLSLIIPYLFIFVFIFLTLGSGFKKILLRSMSKSILLMFPSKGVVVSGLTFRSLIHFEFIFVYGVRQCFNSLFYMELSSFPSTTYWRDCLFSIIYSCLLCHRLMDHRYRGVSLALCSVPLIYIPLFVLGPCCFDYYSFVVFFEIRRYDAFIFVFLSQAV